MSDIREIELDLRKRLKGVRLVSEIGITPQLRRMLKTTFMQYQLTSDDVVERIAPDYPAVYVTYVVAEAIESGTGGEVWTNMVSGIRDSPHRGDRFVEALRRLRLSTFDSLVSDEHAMRYISRVLAHAGLPASCVESFVRFLASDLRRNGVRAAPDLLATWRVERTKLDALPVPARRFILYGGRTAEDLVGRCIDALTEAASSGRVPTADSTGLPDHVAQGLADLPNEQLRRPYGAARGLPRPIVYLDPFDGLGPVVILPAVTADRLGGTWRVWDGEHARDLPFSAIAETRVPLRPAASWSIETQLVDGSSRTWSYDGLEALGVLTLDPGTGRLLRAVGGLEADQVLLVRPAGISVAGVGGDATRLAELPGMSGHWAAYVVDHLDVSDVEALEFSSPADPSANRRVRVLTGSLRPQLDRSPLVGVQTLDGNPVFAELPAVTIPPLDGVPPERWRFTLTCGERGRVQFLDPDGAAEGTVSLERRAASGPDTYRLNVRGPLGSDFSSTFAVVPGLDVERPTQVIFPDVDAVVRLRVSSEEELLEGGSALDISVEPGRASVTARVTAPAGDIDLRVETPTLLWALTHDTKPASALAADRIRVGVEEFEDALNDTLIVRTGRSDVPLELALRVEGEERGPTERADTAGREGRWSFDLGRFAERIRHHADDGATLWLRVGMRTLPVIDVVPKLEVSGIAATTRLTDNFTSVRVTFEQQRRPKGRVVRLWSFDRPWTDAIVAPVPDNETAVELSGYDTIPAGRYLVEVVIDDGWGVPQRPRLGAPHTTLLWVGEREDVEAHLAALDPVNAIDALELVNHGRSRERVWTSDDTNAIGPQAATSLLRELEDVAATQPTPMRTKPLVDLLLADPAVGLAVLADRVEAEQFPTTDVLRLQLRLLTSVVACRAADDDAVLRRCWRTFPLLAAVLDTGNLSEADSRRAQYLRSDLLAGQDVPTGGRVDQQMAGKSRTELELLKRFLALVPEGGLSDAALQLANFEWLLSQASDESGTERAATWFHKYGYFVDDSPGACSPRITEHLLARRRPSGTIWWADVPSATLSAAAHLFVPDGNRSGAQMALSEAIDFAPKLVAHDVLLMTHLTTADRREALDAEPAHC